MIKKSNALSFVYLLLILIVAVFFAIMLRNGNWLQTDLRALLPTEQQWTPLQQQADRQQEQLLNQQIVALVGASDKAQSLLVIEKIAAQWQASGLFNDVTYQLQPNIAQLQQEIQQLKLATLPIQVQEQLLNKSKDYFQQYAEQLVNPFAQTHLLPLEQDWLGLARFTLAQAQHQSKMQWDSQSGLIYILDQEKTWGLLKATLKTDNLINPDQALTQLLENSQVLAQRLNTHWLATGSALFAAVAKQQAEQESQLMSILGVSLTLLLLLYAFRTFKVLWLFLPIGVGMLMGVTATVAYFGHIHILTLVIGTSLIGVLIDFPLHWLSSSLFEPKWQANKAMQRLGSTFLISLLITLLGYGLLGFTRLTVLKQTALFSAIALLSAWLSTILFLPYLLRHYHSKQRAIPTILQFTFPTKLTRFEWCCGGLILILISIGIAKSKWQDDIRQWVAMPNTLLQQAKQIADLTGIDLGNQYFLVTAENEDNLLEKERALTTKLQQRSIPFQSLSQWLMPTTQQRALIQQLQTKLHPTDYQPLVELGIPSDAITTELAQLAQQPLLSLTQAMQAHLGQAWHSFYLGKIDDKVVSIVKVKTKEDLSALADLQQGIYWQDKPSHLNQAFQATRDQAAWLKLLSFVLAGGLLWRYFGWRNSLNMLVIPLCAIVITVGIFGWLGLPISLFAMFGLLLVSAIGIDYTAYMQTAPEPTAQKRFAIILAAVTTLISFLLLGLSSTPAVASFGLSVSLGVLISVLLSFRFLR